MDAAGSSGLIGLVALLFSLPCACHRDPSPAQQTPGAAPVASVTPAASIAAPSAVPALDPAGEVRRSVHTWNDALDRHEVNALTGLYAERVRFYGRDLAGTAVVESKRRALGAQPDFHQELVGDIDVVAGDGGTWVATFTKRSGAAASAKDVRGKLVFRPGASGALAIVEESDAPTEARHAAATSDACEATVNRVVSALPRVKKAILDAQRAADQSGGQGTFGGIGPNGDDDELVWGLGIHTNERFEGTVWYSVTRTGKLSVTVEGEDISAPPAALAEVERACKR